MSNKIKNIDTKTAHTTFIYIIKKDLSSRSPLGPSYLLSLVQTTG